MFGPPDRSVVLIPEAMQPHRERSTGRAPRSSACDRRPSRPVAQTGAPAAARLARFASHRPAAALAGLHRAASARHRMADGPRHRPGTSTLGAREIPDDVVVREWVLQLAVLAHVSCS
ncbi:hypothetical protein HBB16_21670 [Pseudonocardia sp. MCCB 268]|nr:hypothetical protein [Pseudonocardia cytotoxica]